MTRPNPEYNAGARYARASILRALRRAIARGGPLDAAYIRAVDFIKAMPKRAAKRKGGTGRK